MSVEILVNIAPRETRAAILENGVVQEIHIERASRRGLVSNLYKGRVSRVLPGMQAAVVEIGLERTADEAERTRLKTVLAQLLTPGASGRYIVRTAAQGASAEALREDMAYLAKLWDHVRARAGEVPPGSVVHEDLPLCLRVLRDE